MADIPEGEMEARKRHLVQILYSLNFGYDPEERISQLEERNKQLTKALELMEKIGQGKPWMKGEGVSVDLPLGVWIDVTKTIKSCRQAISGVALNPQEEKNRDG